MSSVYVLEPPTRGKVLLHTSAGPLDIELWPKEAPKAVRNFVQLCLDGYYDNTTFHRIIKSFMVQGGDATGTGTGGESIYGGAFADEFHSRLRFNHRGLVACANPGTPNSNNSQFFMTLDRCDWLDRKNTIFGKVTGDTVYNLLKLGETETDEEDRPIGHVPRILSVEVLWSPFDDIIPRQIEKLIDATDAGEIETKNKEKKVKQLNLLSFGEEAEQEEQELAAFNVKIKSSHDVLEDPRLLKGETDNAELDPLEAKRRKDLQTSVRGALSTKNKDGGGEMKSEKQTNAEYNSDDEDDADFDAVMRRRVLNKRKQFGEEKALVRHGRPGKSAVSDGDATPPRGDEDDEKVIKHDKLSLKKKGLGSEGRAELLVKADVDLQLLGPLEQQRHMYKQRKRVRQGREEATLDKLNKFKSTLLKAKEMQLDGIHTVVDDDSGWLAHPLKFAPDPKKQDDMARNEDPNQYVVHDPLLEKGKEKFNKLQAKLKRREREWAGKSVT